MTSRPSRQGVEIRSASSRLGEKGGNRRRVGQREVVSRKRSWAPDGADNIAVQSGPYPGVLARDLPAGNCGMTDPAPGRMRPVMRKVQSAARTACTGPGPPLTTDPVRAEELGSGYGALRPSAPGKLPNTEPTSAAGCSDLRKHVHQRITGGPAGNRSRLTSRLRSRHASFRAVDGRRRRIRKRTFFSRIVDCEGTRGDRPTPGGVSRSLVFRLVLVVRRPSRNLPYGESRDVPEHPSAPSSPGSSGPGVSCRKVL
jgi:hypothetical protein